MKTQNVTVKGMTVSIPAYFRKAETVPEDPDDSVAYMVQTEHAMCFALLYPVTEAESLPREKNSLIAGIRHFLAENQGLIQVEAEKDYVYSIVKNLREFSGVQYILTYQEFHPEGILNVQAYFEEIGTTGIRDSVVFDLYRRENSTEPEEDLFAGWVRDPYDGSIRQGALMNLSEQEQYDEHFSGFPLTLCREFIRALTKQA